MIDLLLQMPREWCAKDWDNEGKILLFRTGTELDQVEMAAGGYHNIISSVWHFNNHNHVVDDLTGLYCNWPTGSLEQYVNDNLGPFIVISDVDFDNISLTYSIKSDVWVFVSQEQLDIIKELFVYERLSSYQ